MSKNKDSKKQNAPTRKVEVAKAGRRAGSLSPQALAQKQQLSVQRHNMKQEYLDLGVEQVIRSFREDGVFAARHTGIVYSLPKAQSDQALAEAKIIFSANVTKLADFIAQRRSKGQNLGFYEVESRYTYRELMAAQVQYKESNSNA